MIRGYRDKGIGGCEDTEMHARIRRSGCGRTWIRGYRDANI